jgi:hypothetical protein
MTDVTINLSGAHPSPDFPLTRLESLRNSKNNLIILLPSQLSEGGAFFQIFARIKRCQATPTFVFYFSGSSDEEQTSFENEEQLSEYLRSSDLLSDFYFDVEVLNVSGYHSARDDLCVISVESKFVRPEDLHEFDAGFATHLIESGIGFGAAGNAYISEIIAQLPAERAQLFVLRDRER